MLRKRPQVAAWFILLSALILFCLLCSVTGYGVYYFLYQSPVQLAVRLVVSRGAVKLQTLDNTNPLVDGQQIIDPQTYLDVRDESQAVLYFQDSYSKQTITTITLTSGTRLFVAEATRPRFEFSRRPYRIDISRVEGQLIVNSQPAGRDYLLDIRSDLGMARLLDDGRYTISTEFYPETKLRRLNLFNQGGVATLYKPTLLEYREVNPNRIAHIASADANPGQFELESDSPFQILLEGRFLVDGTDGTAVGRDTLPDNWSCQSISEQNEPRGQFYRDQTDNFALRFQRIGENRIKHAETACLAASPGLDTAPFSAFRVHTRLKIKSHSLPQCGIVASECPIMIEIAYQIPTRDGSDPPLRKWHHGFYLIPDSSKPSSCDTCRLAHERINPDVWYFYDSGDLRPQLADSGSASPIIRRVSVYASGHEYDALVSEVTLLGTR